MSASVSLAVLFAAIVAVASLRLLLRARDGRERAWRTATLLIGQAASAALLYFVLLPPTVPAESGALVVLTANAGKPGALDNADVVVALPEAAAPLGAHRVPDLGTALRRHPGARPVRILGEGHCQRIGRFLRNRCSTPGERGGNRSWQPVIVEGEGPAENPDVVEVLHPAVCAPQRHHRL